MGKETGIDLTSGKKTESKEGWPGLHAIDGEMNVLSCAVDDLPMTIPEWVSDSTSEW